MEVEQNARIVYKMVFDVRVFCFFSRVFEWQSLLIF